MARLLASFAACPLLGPQKHAQSERTKMMCSSQAPVLRLQSFTGLRASTALELKTRSCQDLFSKVNLSSSSSPKGRRASRCVTKAIFDRFNHEAIEVVVRAQKEGARLGHNRVGSELLLLGLIGESKGTVARVFKYMGINLRHARVEVEKIIGKGTGLFPVEIHFNDSARRALLLSLEEAQELGLNYVGLEHILLGLLREGEDEGDNVVARILTTLSQSKT